MPFDNPDHIAIRQIIDRSLAGESLNPQAQQTLREHLSTCAACSQYHEASNRAVAALGDFSFAIDPALNDKVFAALAARSQQLEVADARHKRLWSVSLLAVVLTVLGSLAVSQLGSFAAPALHLEPAALRVGLATFWITPSVLICMLLLLPGFQALLGSRKGLSI